MGRLRAAARDVHPNLHAVCRPAHHCAETLFGKVRHGKHRATGTVVVIKEYEKRLVANRVTREGVPVAEDAVQEVHGTRAVADGVVTQRAQIRIHQALCRIQPFSPHVVKVPTRARSLTAP
jgi:hypothetical protein